MASGEPPQTSIDGFLLASPSSSPSSSPLDPIEEPIPRLKNAWSEIVRGPSHPVRSKNAPPPPLPDLESAQHHEMHHQTPLAPDANARVPGKMHPSLDILSSPSSAAVHVKFQEQYQEQCLDASSAPLEPMVEVADASISADDVHSPRVDRRQADLIPEMSVASPDGSVKPAQPSPAKSPKSVWGKPSANTGKILEPEPVMGAIAWPALSEARTTKPLDQSKSSATQRATPSTLPSSSDEHHLQAPPLLHRDVGGSHRVLSNMTTQKSHNQHQIVGNGTNLPVSTTIDAVSLVKSAHLADDDLLKRTGSRETKFSAVSDSSAVYQRGTAVNPVSNIVAGNTRNFMRDQGRGNPAWPAYGRVYANTRENTVSSQHQRAVQRNMPHPFVPFITPNPGFVHAAAFPNVPGSMYYIQSPPSEPLLGATYFVPPGVQGVLMPGSDPTTLQGLLIKQIEYYFSVENLCRDIYLRSNMDERGFVPVSVIGNFNRVRMITQNPFFILEALRMSNVVEVQGDKVRKRGDWANWLLPSTPQSASLSIPSKEGDQISRLSSSFKKAEVDHSRSVVVDNQTNGLGHSNIATQVGEKSEPHLMSGLNVLQDPYSGPFLPEITATNRGDGSSHSIE